MDKQNVIINGETINIPAYYQKVDSMPGDPAGAEPYMVQTPNAVCLLLISAEDYSKSLPRTQDDLISGIRSFLAENQGLIKVSAEPDHVYSIVKNLQQPSGVQYILTYQKFCKDFILNVQGFFEEAGMTGIRDSMGFAMCKQNGIVGNDEDTFAGWMKDPYDESIKTGALMNLSEQEEFDEQFPGFPLTMCREFVNCVTETI